jgi:hypothetical protein
VIAYLRPILRKLSPFFETRLNSGPETLCTVLRKLCDVFKQGSSCFGPEHHFLRAESFRKFFGVTMEQHFVDGLEFLFEGCKWCIIRSSSQGYLHQLSIDIFSTLCYRLKPHDPLYEPVIDFVKTHLKAFSLVKQELVICDHLPGDVLNTIAWDFATNPKLSDSVREHALSYLDLNDPFKKQEILQNKCRARTFEPRLLGFSILLQASLQRSHPQAPARQLRRLCSPRPSRLAERYVKAGAARGQNAPKCFPICWFNLFCRWINFCPATIANTMPRGAPDSCAIGSVAHTWHTTGATQQRPTSYARALRPSWPAPSRVTCR